MITGNFFKRIPDTRIFSTLKRTPGSGDVLVESSFSPGATELPDLPRFGMQMTVPGGFETATWYGRGPHENYPDRKGGAMLGIWDGVPDEPPYLVPQEFGLRTDCRWFEFIDPTRGEVVRVDAVSPQGLHISATNFLASDLFEAETETELRRTDGLVVCLDGAHRGLGTASCGPDVLPQYRVAAGRHEFAYRVCLRLQA